MAVYAAVVSLARTAEQLLNNYHHYSNISVQEKQHIESIHAYAVQLQAFFHDFPTSKYVSIITEVYDAEDVIEYLMWNHQIRSSSGSSTTPRPPTLRHERFEREKYADYLSIFNDINIMSNHTTEGMLNMTTNLKRLKVNCYNREGLTYLSNLVRLPRLENLEIRSLNMYDTWKNGDFNFPRTLSWNKMTDVCSWQNLKVLKLIDCACIDNTWETTFPVSLHAPSSHKDVMIGFGNGDLETIKNRLFGESSQLQVIAIVGIGGIGKTTLARSAYDDPSVEELFQTRAWVVDYHPDPFLIMEGPDEEISSGFLSSVCERLKSRRYLIVMDDIDMCNAQVWDGVRSSFPDDNNGSRIVITTRLLEVAAYRCSYIHEMHLLDNDKSWDLLRRNSFANLECCSQELENIGKEMARRCRGFPLAVVVSAGLLWTISKVPVLWEEIAGALSSTAEYGPRRTLNLDGFSKDDDVGVSTLVGLWIATIENLMLMLNHPQLGDRVTDLESARNRIESIVEDIMTHNNRFAIKQKSSDTTSSSKFVPSHNDVMIGFDDDLLKMQRLLCGESSQLHIIPILGMGGIGKTTLARNAYDDPLTDEHFDIRAWVTISQDYSAEEILSILLDAMGGFVADISKQNNDEKVFKHLKGRRYLIVLDDMWSTKAWDDLKMLFPDDGIGSRIMLTTRLMDVASYPDQCCSIHEIHFMDENKSWKLLHQKVFPHQDVPPELIEIGKEIAKACGGLPLAIVVVAGLLSTISKTPTCWEEVAENIKSVIAGKDRQFKKILSLSYTHLPHYLRPCFLHLGAFPEDHEIRVSKLTKLWVAEGFLNGSEAEAEECLESLVKRSLVSVKNYKSNGRIKSVGLHDLMRDLCIRKARKEQFLANIRDENILGSFLFFQRRMSIAFPGPIQHSLRTYGSPIHTILWFLYTSLPCLEGFRLLRVLDAGDGDVESLPAILFELFHLRYLAINYPGWIPEDNLSQLQSLQTLIIRARGQWKHEANHDDCLPQEIWRMPNLRHVFFYGTLPDPEETNSPLENLQTLVFSLSNHTTEGTLKMTPNLKRLKLNCYNRRDRAGYLTNMVHLIRLESLEVRSHNMFDTWEKSDFNFPRMLKKLTLSGLRLSWNEMTAVCSLPNLQVLKLKDYACIDSTWETDEGEFPELEYLLVEKSPLEDWISESCHFPKLKFLLIHDCVRLSEIPNDFGESCTLELIEVKGHVKKSLVESAKRIQEEQKEWGNDEFQVRCVTRWTNDSLP